MTEVSMFWNGTTVGDAVLSPYDASSEFAGVLRALAYTNSLANKGGVFKGVASDLTVTGAGSPVAVHPGEALVDGIWYKSDGDVGIAVPTPSSATRIDRLVLRKSWAAQTVRLTLIAGVEGGSEPALVQTAGVTWDIPIASVSITTGGVITLSDQRDVLLSGAQGLATARYVPIIPAVTINHPGLATSNPTLALPSAVPANAKAVNLHAYATPTSGNLGSASFSDAASDAVGTYGISLTFSATVGTNDAGVVNVNQGTPCTVTATIIVAGSGNCAVDLAVSGYWL